MAGLLTAESGRVQLRCMDEYDPDRPLSRGMTAWEGCMRMAYHLNREHGGGVAGAAQVARGDGRLGREHRFRRAAGAHPLQPLRSSNRLRRLRGVQQPRNLLAGNHETDAGTGKPNVAMIHAHVPHIGSSAPLRQNPPSRLCAVALNSHELVRPQIPAPKRLPPVYEGRSPATAAGSTRGVRAMAAVRRVARMSVRGHIHHLHTPPAARS